MTSSKGLISLVEREHILSLLDHGKRADGRAFDEFRKIAIIPNFIPKAEGSALVKIGQTKVIVGVKGQVGAPFPDTPDQGVVTTSVELIPIASPIYESGPPGEEAIELARVADRALRESNAVDLQSLSLSEGKSVWILFVDIYVLDHDGNLFDACALASLIALMRTHLPECKVTKLDDGTEEISFLETTHPLKIDHIPITCTFAKIGKNLIVDPSLKEQSIQDARLTLAFTGEGKICATQKGESGSFIFEEISKCIDIATERTKEIRTHLDEWSDPEGNPWSEDL